MASTITPIDGPRPNRTKVRVSRTEIARTSGDLSMGASSPARNGVNSHLSVRRVSTTKAGRLTDCAVLGLEGSLEGEVVILEDERLDADWSVELRHNLGVLRSYIHQIYAGVAVRPQVDQCFRTLLAITEEIAEREYRLRQLEPLQKAVVTRLDAEIENRYFAKRAARRSRVRG